MIDRRKSVHLVAKEYFTGVREYLSIREVKI